MAEYIKAIRELVGHRKLLVPATACIIVDRTTDSILLQERSDTGRWGCPGGIMDFGETVIQSLMREVREETGLRIDSPWLLGVYSGGSYDMTYPNGDALAVVQLAFVVESFTGVLGGDAESRSLRFFSFDELPATLVPNHEPIIADYLRVCQGDPSAPFIR